MKKNNLLLGILALVLVFTMTAVGCGEDPNDPTGPQWVPVTGEQITGTLSADGTTLTLTNNGETTVFTKSSGGLDGVWISNDKGVRLTISGKTWISASEIGGAGGGGPDISDYFDMEKGTLTVNGTTIILIVTHRNSDDGGGGGNDDVGGGGGNTVLSGTSWSHYDENHGATEVLSFSSTGNSVTLIDPWVNLSGTYTVTGSNVTIIFTSISVQYTGVISGTTLIITTDRNETQRFEKQQ